MLHADSITLHVQGATEAEIARGEAAARSVFEKANRYPFAAASAFAAVEFTEEMEALNEEDAAFDDVGIAAWVEAFPAAVNACCEGWTDKPIYTNFIVRPEGEPLPPRNAVITAGIDCLLAMPDEELHRLWVGQPDMSDPLASLIYWAANERRLNSFAAVTTELVNA